MSASMLVPLSSLFDN